MNTKAFVILIVAALAFGGALAGSFIGGTFVGKSQAESAQQVGGPVQFGSVTRVSAGSDGEAPDPQAIRQALSEAGVQMDKQEAQQLRSRLRAQFGQGNAGGAAAGTGDGGDAGGFAGFGGGVFGTVKSVEGSKLTIESPGGEVTVNLGEETTVRKFAEIEVDDMEIGSTVTVLGSRDESGAMEARSITVVPEGEGFPALPGMGGGQGFGGGQGSRGGQGFGGGRTRGQGGGAP